MSGRLKLSTDVDLCALLSTKTNVEGRLQNASVRSMAPGLRPPTFGDCAIAIGFRFNRLPRKNGDERYFFLGDLTGRLDPLGAY